MPSWSAVSCFRVLKKGYDGAYRRDHETNFNNSTDNRSSIISEDRKGVSIVELIKKEGTTLGLIISGGIDKGTKPRISNLRPGRIAHKSDCLAVGDHIVSVNGIRTSKLKHDEIITLLKNAGDKVTLEVEYEMPSSNFEGSSRVCPKVIQLQLEKENDSFGFTLRGGFCKDKLKSKPLTITHVRFGGPANREGSIKTGDRLLAVDGINFNGATLQEALNVLKQINGVAVLTIEYDVAFIDAVKNACGPLLVEIDKAPGTPLGVNLTCLSVPEPAIVIESIRQASVAERCGALHVGDHILSIDGVKVDPLTSVEAMQLLKSSSSETVKLEILPVSQMAKRRVPDINMRKGGTIPHYMAARASFTNSCYNTLSSLGNFSADASGQFQSNTPPLVGSDNWHKATVFNPLANHVSCPSLTASLTTSVNTIHSSIGHADTTEVTLPASFRGFGFVLQSSTFATHVLATPPVIRSIESGSIAEKCGTLQVGDRVLAVNNTLVMGLTLDEVTQMIVHSHPKVTLKTEFDVAEGVVPSSGTFVVKLVKIGDSNLGITMTGSSQFKSRISNRMTHMFESLLTAATIANDMPGKLHSAPVNRQSNNPLMISAVEKGSVAHRSGTIQPGDKLLAIDSIRMENCSIEDALTILQSCSDIVTLRIRKDDSFPDDPDITFTTIYTVEIARHGGLLGITVSGTEEPLKPILISGLTKNGLAERTGALHVGDRILAINGICLKGKPLSEAIQVLQSCGDVVTLKISRMPNTGDAHADKETELEKECKHCLSDIHLKTYTTPLSSTDSALESWDSCNLETCNSAKAESKFSDSTFSGSHLPYQLSNPCKSLSQISVDSQHSRHDDWENRSHSTHSSYGISERHSAQSDDESGNWSKVLEDLQTCGQSQLLRQIECTILGHDGNGILPEFSTSDSHLINDNSSKHASDGLSEQSLQELSAQIEQLGSDLNVSHTEERLDLPEQSCSYKYENNFNCDTSQSNSYENNHSPSFTMALPVEVHKVTLFKDQVYEDFGFSVSDAQYEQGVYIQCIRSGGPADLSGLIKPLDRILQVNNINTYDHGCCLTVPLIASSGDRIELVVSRPAYDLETSSESTLGHVCEYQQWNDNVDCENNLSSYPFCETQTLTKTL